MLLQPYHTRPWIRFLAILVLSTLWGGNVFAQPWGSPEPGFYQPPPHQPPQRQVIPAPAQAKSSPPVAPTQAKPGTGEPSEPDAWQAVRILKGFTHLSKESATCVSCHKEKSQGLYQQWGESSHFGANVGCYECHRAKPGEPDAITHKDFVISVLVTPKDCAQCHQREVEEFDASHHASAGQILGSLDNVLAEVVAGAKTFNGHSPDVVSGCAQCHGSKIQVNSDGSLDAATWPNSGIGRINPDGSKGSCAACHSRHSFSSAQARHPDTCGKCHLGPDHPQKEIYESSKHGISFFANIDRMHLDSPKWVVGEDYSAAPTCATCHMSATRNQPISHDIGARISWNLRAPVSRKIDAQAIAKGKKVKPWLERRKDMKDVCTACHARNFSDNFYEQLDAFVGLYNDKFAIPGASLIALMRTEKLLTPTAFDEKLEWIWFELWHHEGRRARHGAAMMGPDFAHWHGMYEVSKHFYMELVPEIREIIKKARHDGKQEAADRVAAHLADILNSEHHRWFLGQQATP